MEWLDKMNGALEYIEMNLTENIDLAEVAKRACCSSFNFQRMFSFVADVTLAEYIRKRRLSMAAMDLLGTDEKVIDIALKYGYDSPVSFARAFHTVHGINPSDVKKPGAQIKSYPPIKFEITIKGVSAMNYRIEEMKEFRLVGCKERVSMNGGENFLRIPEFWNQLSREGKYDEIMKYNDNKSLSCMGVCVNADKQGFDYYIATGSDEEIPETLEELNIPANTYVKFECIGKLPEGQQKVWKRIFSEWFPTASYELVDGPQIEWYSEQDPASDKYQSEIWIPVRKK